MLKEDLNMPRPCAVCCHQKREEIERALISKQSVREISALFRVSEDSLQRHKQTHFSDKLAKAVNAKEVLEADSLLQEMSELRDKLRHGLAEAELAGSGAGVVAFSRELRNTLESYFQIQDRMAQRKIESGEGKHMHVVVETSVAPTICPHCGKPLAPVTEVLADYMCAHRQGRFRG